jgi:hypothetical protein
MVTKEFDYEVAFADRRLVMGTEEAVESMHAPRAS